MRTTLMICATTKNSEYWENYFKFKSALDAALEVSVQSTFHINSIKYIYI